jgi:putative transposase
VQPGDAAAINLFGEARRASILSLAEKMDYLEELVDRDPKPGKPIPITKPKTTMGTYRQIFYQIVFGTKNRKPTINAAHENELYKYINGIITNKNCKMYQINGMEDHLHIMCDLHPSLCLADFVKNIKVSSSLHMKTGVNFRAFEAWQEGYGAFTYSIRDKDRIINYIKGQKEHHQTENFFDEFKRLLTENEIEFDEKFLL